MNKFKTINVLNTKYAYALGVIRALETRLFTSKDFSDFISSVDVEELVSGLHDSDYGSYLRELDSNYNFDVALEKAKIDTYKIIEGLIEEESIINMIRAPYDFHNISVLLKGKIAEEDFSEYCHQLGRISVKKMLDIFRDEIYNHLPEYLEIAVRKGTEAYFSHNHNIQLLNFAIDREMSAYLTTCEENKYLKDYYKVWVDITNIKIIMRLFYQERYDELINHALLPGGFIEKERIIKSKLENVESAEGIYRGTDYSYLLKFRDSFSELEKESELLLLSYVKSISYESMGAEPVIEYLFLKENEIRNLRMIFTGKINGVDNEILEEKLII